MRALRFNCLSVLTSVVICVSSAMGQNAAPAVRIVNPIDEEQLVTLRGTVHPLANAKNDRGAAPDSAPLERIHLMLKRSARQQAALDQLVAGLAGMGCGGGNGGGGSGNGGGGGGGGNTGTTAGAYTVTVTRHFRERVPDDHGDADRQLEVLARDRAHFRIACYSGQRKFFCQYQSPRMFPSFSKTSSLKTLDRSIQWRFARRTE
jgi:hypothetical protein